MKKRTFFFTVKILGKDISGQDKINNKQRILLQGYTMFSVGSENRGSVTR